PALGVRSGVETIDLLGWIGLFVIGLGWSMWLLERLALGFERRRIEAELAGQGDHVRDGVGRVSGNVRRPPRRIRNPFALAACFYGRSGQRLKQSFLGLLLYTAGFVTVYLLAGLRSHASGVEPFELPAGGGQEAMAQKMRIQKVVRKKYIINPYSTLK